MTSDIDDIFNIPTDGSHLDESGSPDDAGYANTRKKKSNAPFSDELKRLAHTIGDPQPNSVHSEGCLNEKCATSAPTDDIAESVPVPVVEKKAMTKKKSDILEIACEEEAMDGSAINCADTPLDGEWRLSHPDHKFSSFYEMKSRALKNWLLPGGKLKFQELNQELKTAQVNLSNVALGDIANLFDKMRAIQALKDRVTYITTCCNEQYYLWKRAIDIFTGVLARIQYLKPAQRQVGLNAEHMADMERYLSELEALHFNTDHVLRNLESAYEMISRSVTMSMPSNRDVESAEKKVNKAFSAVAGAGKSVSFLDQMDSVPQNSSPSRISSASNTQGKTGITDWKV